MSMGISEIIDHLVAGNICIGEAMAAVHEAEDKLQRAYDKMQEAFNHAAAAQGNGSSDTLSTVLHADDAAKRKIESAIAANSGVASDMALAQEKAQEYIGRLQA